MELPYTLTLIDPVKFGSEEITELVFGRKPIAKDLRGIRLGELDKGDNIILLTARLTNQPPSVVDQLSFADVAACGEVVSGFLSVGPRTGTASADS